MASKTVARSRARTSRSKAGSRQGARPGRPAAPRRKPPKRRHPSPVATAGATAAGAVRATWLMLAKGTG
ncbi:MAG: hypothetical protein ACRDTV_21225, partial [Mycobacterium sp.]